MLEENTSMLIDINSDYIQALYRDRDEALARNRELEEQVQSYGDSIEALEGIVGELRELAKDLLFGLQECWDNEYSLEELQSLQTRVKELLEEKN